MSYYKKKKNRDAFTEINITPLTDIFLVLLIIMMVIAPLLDQQGISLVVPTTKEAQKQEKDPEIISVDVSESGEYKIDGSLVSSDDLMAKLKAVYNEKKDGLLVKAAENSTHEAVVRVMDAAQAVGIANVSVMAEFK